MEGRKPKQLARAVMVLKWLEPLRYGASLQQIMVEINRDANWSEATIRRDLEALCEAGQVEKIGPGIWKAIQKGRFAK